MEINGVPFNPATNIMMADSGTSLNMIPDSDFNRIQAMFFADKHCWVLPNTLTACDCTQAEHDAIPGIDFKIAGNQYTMPRDLWYERGANGMCVIKFMHGPSKGNWILGLNFFTNYYTVFDYESKRIGFAESIKFGKANSKTFIEWATSASTLMNLVSM